MTEQSDCGTVQPLLAEMATGAASGHDRANVLQHIAACGICRRELTELAQAADALLLLAPRVEPPAGFETGVLARLASTERRPLGRRLLAGARRLMAPGPGRAGRLGRRLVAVTAALAIAVGSGAAVVWWHTESDRQLAAQYRQTLATADGRYLKAAHLTADRGASGAGTVFLYQGNPSWLLITVAGATDGRYTVITIDRDGASWTAGNCTITNHTGTSGYRLNIPVRRVAEIHLRGPNDTELIARL
jgi:hypothetical protein